MKEKLELVLDLAGVLVTNFSPNFWMNLSSSFNVSYNHLTTFKKEIREELWTGKIREDVFWTMLKREFPVIDINVAKSKLYSALRPLPAIERIPLWSQNVNVHIVSNHRIEWVSSIISPLQDHLTSMTISSEIGHCKPHVDIYLEVQNHFTSNHHVWFVDDQEKNLVVARKLGWNALLADEGGEWVKKVNSLIEARQN